MDQNAARCPKCGAPISDQAHEGLCPVCLFSEAAKPTQPGQASRQKCEPPSLEELRAAFPQLEILSLIGRGGMGFVFKARQPRLDRFVALKILPESLATDPAFAERFSQEGRVLARLNHPNIVTIYDFGQSNGLFYLLMEFVDGVNLRQALQAGRFTPEQALAVAPKICDALEFAHEEGILHRDIKPENILLDARGRVKIADFGIAKIVGADAGTAHAGPNAAASTQATGVLGTPNYMAPEQVKNPRLVDRRADVYALGVVFYEMLTGELPLGRFAPPSTRVAVDPRVDEVVMRTLEQEPQRRTASAGEVRTQLATIAAEPPSAPPEANPPPPVLTGPNYGLHLWRAGKAAFITFIACGLALGFLLVTLPDTYMSMARVQLEAFSNFDPYRVQTDLEKIRSDPALTKVAAALSLPERWGKKYGVNQPMAISEVCALLRRSIELVPIRNTALVEIQAFSDDPIEAAALANAVAETCVKAPSPVRAQLVDRASPAPRPIRPNRPQLIGFGAFLTVLACGFTFTAVGLGSLWLAVTRSARSVKTGADPHLRRLTWACGAAAACILLGLGFRWTRAHSRLPSQKAAESLSRGFEAPPKPASATVEAPPEAPDEPARAAGATKVLLFDRVEIDGAQNRLSLWTSSPIPTEGVLKAVLSYPDGREESALHQTITIRGRTGARTTTVFSWQLPPEVSAEAVQSTKDDLPAGRPLALQPNASVPLFSVTNRAGGILQAYLRLERASPAETSSAAREAIIQFTSVTNISHMVLGYFTSTAVPGFALQAGGTGPDGQETEAHTSIARSATYSGDDCRWDLPADFDREITEAARGQLLQLTRQPLVVAPGQPTTVFALTNRDGRVYRAFFTLAGSRNDSP